MIPHTWLVEAAEQIAPHIRKTPLTFDPGSELYIKWENHQVTGSFKARGAFNKILTLQDWERHRGLVAASAGNHGQGVALAGRLVGAPVIIFASEHATPAKLSAMRELGAEVRLTPGGYGEAELAGIEYAQSSGKTWVSPYNDGQVIAGQGTLALEILADQPDLPAGAVWSVPVGGGGLISGIGAAIKQADIYNNKMYRLVAVQSEASQFFHAIYTSGTQEGVIEMPSLADGLAGPVESGSITIPIVKRLVDEFILVSEKDIAEAIKYAWTNFNEKIEGSAAAALAAALTGRVRARPVVVIISGGNIQPQLHQAICAGQPFHV